MTAFLFLLFLGLIFRLLLVGNPGFIADISFWKSWSLAAIDHGITWTAYNTNINYPPGFIYILFIMGKIYTFFGDPHKFESFWKDNNFGFLLASKSIAIAADMVIASLIYWFFSQKKKLQKLGAAPEFHRHLPLLLSAAFYLNPVVIIDSALWGQVESLGILFTIVAIVLLFYKRPSVASAVFTIGTLIKLQNIIYIPLFFLFIARFFDRKTLVKSLTAAAIAFFIVTLPFIFKNGLNQVLYLMTVNSDYFPWLSLNAHNLWWIVAGARGMQITDKVTVLGILNAKTVGLVLFSLSYLYCMIVLYKKPTARNFFYTLTVAIFAFFLWTTQSHERYSYPVMVFLLFLYPFLEGQSVTNKHPKIPVLEPDVMQRHSNKQRVDTWWQEKGSLDNVEEWKNLVSRMRENKFSIPYFWLLYLFAAVIIFLNIHTGLILNYPENGFSTLTKITTPTLTIVNSYAHILLFFLLIPYSFSQISPLVFGFLLTLTGLSFVFLHASYLISGKVYLSSFKPIIAGQDFGFLQFDKSVNSGTGGWKSLNRLSNNYFYYRKGFGTHANSTLVFDINRKFRQFATDYGIDTEAASPATVVFQIFGDDRLLFTSTKMGKFDFPKHVKVDITGVKLLKLAVTDAGDGINSDHADWLNPILYR